jgi:hypothetical protein
MPLSAIDLANHILNLFPGATRLGRSCWSTALQNGRSHVSRVYLDDDTAILTTGPLGIPACPQQVLAWNALLPAASRIVWTGDGLELRTEWAIAPDADGGDLWERARRDFQTGLDVLGGETVPPNPDPVPASSESEGPAPHWNARLNEDGAWSISLPHEQAAVRASATLVTAGTLAEGDYPDEVRAAAAEALLRGTSHLRFVKACAAPGESARWSAWIQASPVACGLEEALASVALAHVDCADAVRALQEVRLAQRYRQVSSVWRNRQSNPNEGR